jgi:PEP-CTERM motif
MDCFAPGRASVFSRCRFAAALTVAVLSVGPVRGQLVINPTYDASITSNPNAAQIQAGIQAAINRVQAAISNPITVNITFQSGAGSLGASNTAFITVPYGPRTTAGTYLNALTTHQVLSANDTLAQTSLPNTANNPVNGDPAGVDIATPLARALGFSAATPSDSTITLDTTQMYFNRGAPVAGKYDLQAVAAHEIDEALGAGGFGSNLGTGASSVGVLDLFRYASPGVRSYATGNNLAPYFSIDGGTTIQLHFNQNGNGDFGDWGNGNTPAQQAGNTPPAVQDAFGTPAVNIDIGPVERTSLDVIGYNLTAVPEPGTMALLGGVLAIGAGRRVIRRRRV